MDIMIRRSRRSDGAALERFYAGLSAESRRLRFCGYSTGISHRQALAFCTPDHEHREGFVAIARTGHRPARIVGHLCLEPTDASTVEAAIAVDDGFQRRGIGRRLMEAGIAWARSEGIHRITATTLVSNGPIRRLLASLGLAMSTRAEGPDTAVVTIDLDRPDLLAA